MVTVIAVIAFAGYIVWLIWTFAITTLRSLRTSHDSRFRSQGMRGMAAVVMLLIYVGLILVGVGALLAIWGISVVRLPSTLAIVLGCLGLAVMLAGAGIAIVAQHQLSDSWRVGVDATEITGLVTTGVFSVVRNPFFSATMLLTFGMVLTSCSPLTLAGAICFAIGVTIQVVHQEEPALEANHGDAYRMYKARTGRFFPLLKKAHP